MTRDIDAILEYLRPNADPANDGAYLHHEEVAVLLAAFDAMRERADFWAAKAGSLANSLSEAERKLAEAERQRDAAVEALKPFAKFAGDLSLLKQRIFLQLLVCPENDEHPENYGPHFQRARAIVQEAQQ